MLGKGQVAASLMAQRAAYRALIPADRWLEPGAGVGIQLAGLRFSGKPQRPSNCEFGHEALVLAFAVFAAASSRPGQHRAVWRQRGRQVAGDHRRGVRRRSLERARQRRGSEPLHPVAAVGPARSARAAVELFTRTSRGAGSLAGAFLFGFGGILGATLAERTTIDLAATGLAIALAHLTAPEPSAQRAGRSLLIPARRCHF